MPQSKASVFIATSPDGFIARVNGDIDWLPQGADSAGEDYGFAEFMKTVDALRSSRRLRFLNAGAIERLIITRVSSAARRGNFALRLSGEGRPPEARDDRAYPSGLVQSEYKVVGTKKRPSVKKARVTKSTKRGRGSRLLYEHEVDVPREYAPVGHLIVLRSFRPDIQRHQNSTGNPGRLRSGVDDDASKDLRSAANRGVSRIESQPCVRISPAASN